MSIKNFISRFCGKDDVKANDILCPGDKDEELIQAYKSTKENQEDCYHHRPDKVAEISKFLFGQVKAEIWGCRINYLRTNYLRTCYEGFETEIELENHRTKDHEGRVRHGTLYDMASKVFTCPACNFVFKKCHLVKFIYHRKKCSIDPELGLQQDLEEDFQEDDTTDHTIDPWGVVNKPLRIINDRSRWVCEALTGNFYPIIYPCHVCYQVLTDEKLIKEHFRAEHPNVENCCENGHYYNRKTDSYTCPSCKKQVCKNQKNSIFFIHHMQKCQGVNHLVVWSCDKCEKEFTQFRTYTYHMKTNCETQDFICHICKMQLKTRKDLRNHLTFVHSTFRPHVCNMCSKSFKRKGDLVSHQKNHDSSIQFSCEHCGKLFNHLKKLKRHMLCHMSYMERQHKCPHCTLRFMLKQKLLNHVATHFDVKKFACDICDVRVKTRDALWAHKKKVHKITAKAGQAIAQLEPNFDLHHQPIRNTQTISTNIEQSMRVEEIENGGNDLLTSPEDLPIVAANIVASTTTRIIVNE